MLLTEPFNKQELTSVISILYYTEFSAVHDQWVQPEGCANPASSPYNNSCLVLSPVTSADQWKWGRKPVQITVAWRTKGGTEADFANASIFLDSTLFVNRIN